MAILLGNVESAQTFKDMGADNVRCVIIREIRFLKNLILKHILLK